MFLRISSLLDGTWLDLRLLLFVDLIYVLDGGFLVLVEKELHWDLNQPFSHKAPNLRSNHGCQHKESHHMVHQCLPQHAGPRLGLPICRKGHLFLNKHPIYTSNNFSPSSSSSSSSKNKRHRL